MFSVMRTGEMRSIKCVCSPLCGRGGDTDDHYRSIGEDLLQSFIGLAFLQIVSKFLSRKHKRRIYDAKTTF